jgi:hypothetical protein
MSIHGNAKTLSLSMKKVCFPVLQCIPHAYGDNIFWLYATIAQLTNIATVYAVDYDLMHRCFGHSSKNVLKRAQSHTKGFPSITFDNEDSIYTGCAEGKMPSKAFPSSDKRAKKLFDKVHFDLKSFPVESYHKYKYFITFIDDYSSFSCIVLLHNKALAINALIQFLAIVKNQFSNTIKSWMSNAGGEYKSDKFLTMLKDNGINILQSVPHTPQQNGHAECFMRTCMDKAEAMHHQACLPQSWWEFAVEHAVHVYNQTPIQRLEWRTPYKLLYHSAPDISHF